MEAIMNQLQNWVLTYGLNVVAAIVILIVGRMVAGMIRSLIKRGMRKGDLDEGLIGFVGNLAYFGVIIMVVIAALAKFGIQTASFVAIIGAAGFAVGFALQGSLANFASGVMILMFRPFKVGDFVEAAGISGSVKQIGVFATTVHTPDNVRIIVPNGQIYGGIIKNYSANETRRVDLLIGIGYGSSIEAATQTILRLISADERTLKDPEPMVAVSELADSSVNLVVRAWVDADDYWPTKFDLTRKIKETFDQESIEIPFPQTVVHHAKES